MCQDHDPKFNERSKGHIKGCPNYKEMYSFGLQQPPLLQRAVCLKHQWRPMIQSIIKTANATSITAPVLTFKDFC